MSGDVPSANIAGEFVTSGFFGGLPGDPDGGKTRVVTQNRGKSREETRRDEKRREENGATALLVTYGMTDLTCSVCGHIVYTVLYCTVLYLTSTVLYCVLYCKSVLYCCTVLYTPMFD